MTAEATLVGFNNEVMILEYVVHGLDLRPAEVWLRRRRTALQELNRHLQAADSVTEQQHGGSMDGI
jgi:hypothetical protein